MDRVLEKKAWSLWRTATVAAGALVVVAVVYLVLTSLGTRRLNVDRSRLTIGAVETREFQELIPLNAQVMPLQTVYLESAEGGRVEELYLEEGGPVAAGDPVLRLVNTDLELDLRRREDQLYEQRNLLRNVEDEMDEARREFQRRLAELDYQIVKARRIYERDAALSEAGLIADLEFELSRDEYEFLLERRQAELANEEEVERSRQAKIRQAADAVERMQANYQLAKEKFDKLLIRAPLAGQLTSLEVEVGEATAPGERLGQIDVLDGFKARAQVDQHYIARVSEGQTAQLQADGRLYRLRVLKIFPEVKDNRFEIDLEFLDELPAGIKRGQNLSLKLELSDPATAVVVPRGAFYQKTAGRWIYVLDAGGENAERRDIRLGRQNPDYFEVLDGLEAGERVITSSYDGFSDVDRLVLRH